MRTISLIFLAVLLASGMGYSEENVLARARKMAETEGVKIEDINSGIKEALWNKDKSAVAIAFYRPKGSLCVVYIRTSEGEFKELEIKRAESDAFGRLGFKISHYDRFVTKPYKWADREDVYHIHYITRTWKDGQRYTSSGQVVITHEGKPIYQ
jgi:hypothetical protein